jgi:hypothetical protein
MGNKLYLMKNFTFNFALPPLLHLLSKTACKNSSLSLKPVLQFMTMKNLHLRRLRIANIKLLCGT